MSKTSNVKDAFGANRLLLLAAVMTALIATAVASPATASSGTLTITSDTRLTADHMGQIQIATDGVSLDCAGHTVRRPPGGPDHGIVLDGTSGVTVKNCRVTGFETGIIVADWNEPSYGNTLVANTSSGNSLVGFALLGTSGNTVRSNRALDNGNSGFLLRQSFANDISFNTARRSGYFGFCLVAASQNDLLHNVASGTGTAGSFGAGFLVEQGSNDNSLEGNVAINNGAPREDAEGFQISASVDNELRRNVANRNAGRGFTVVTSTGTVLERNVASKNGSIGFALNTSSANMLRRNSAKGNRGPGFDIYLSETNTLEGNISSGNRDGGFHLATSSGNTLTGNVANRNRNVGFDVYFDSHSNVLSENAGHGNVPFDARDAGTGNVWQLNSFGTTSGITTAT